MVGFSYSKLYGLPITGLRFFTVYGPAGRPDMAYFNFTKDIIEGRKIRVFNHGDLYRDFTYIDDIVAGIFSVCTKPPNDLAVPHRIINLGNSQPVKLSFFIEILEDLIGVKAITSNVDMQQGDVYTTGADISLAKHLFGYNPTTNIEVGLSHFVNWYTSYYSR